MGLCDYQRERLERSLALLLALNDWRKLDALLVEVAAGRWCPQSWDDTPPIQGPPGAEYPRMVPYRARTLVSAVLEAWDTHGRGAGNSWDQCAGLGAARRWVAGWSAEGEVCWTTLQGRFSRQDWDWLVSHAVEFDLVTASDVRLALQQLLGLVSNREKKRPLLRARLERMLAAADGKVRVQGEPVTDRRRRRGGSVSGKALAAGAAFGTGG